MQRNNVTTWRDCCTITRLQGALADAMMKYQMYAAPREDGKWGAEALGGDQSLMIAAIELRNRLNDLIERSRVANSR